MQASWVLNLNIVDHISSPFSAIKTIIIIIIIIIIVVVVVVNVVVVVGGDGGVVVVVVSMQFWGSWLTCRTGWLPQHRVGDSQESSLLRKPPSCALTRISWWRYPWVSGLCWWPTLSSVNNYYMVAPKLSLIICSSISDYYYVFDMDLIWILNPLTDEFLS